MKTFLLWSEIDFLWSDIRRSDGFMLWSDIALIEEVESILRGGGGSPDLRREYEEGNPWRKLSEQIGTDKTERFIKIFCTINNVEYEGGKFLKENIKVSVSQFEKVFNESIKIKVSFENNI
jgi:hypothetical protein